MAELNLSEIEESFKENISKIFGENLIFGFICGGFAKGYATTSDHDVDMFICLAKRNAKEEEKFKEFYFDLHKRFSLTPDHIDSGEIATFTQLLEALNLLDNLKISLVIKYYREYEAIVWGDMFSGEVIAKTGNVDLLEIIQSYCKRYPVKWRGEVLDRLDKNVLDSEINSISQLSITRIFRRYVTYLKKENDEVKSMNVCILGGGGNVAEAICSQLITNGHKVSQFRFLEQETIQGVPRRPTRSLDRIKELKIITNNSQTLASQNVETITSLDYEGFAKFDVFIFAYPSYMAEVVAERLGSKLIDKPIVNLSDRFLGSYSLIKKMQQLYGSNAIPSVCVAFNGVPIMAIKADRESPTTVYYVKPKHSIAWYPQTREARSTAYTVLVDLFKFKQDSFIPYPTMLHLAFENAHCIEHAVVDLANLKAGSYSNPSVNLYSNDLYKNEYIERIERIIKERNKVSQKIVGRKFFSLKDYDERVFGNRDMSDLNKAGTNKFRIEHSSLSKAPNLSKTTAFGYEDIGWSIVTLESFAKLFNVQVPEISNLIDEWNEYMNCDYRSFGRTVSSLKLLKSDKASYLDYRDLQWLENFMTQEAENGILNRAKSE